MNFFQIFSTLWGFSKIPAGSPLTAAAAAAAAAESQPQLGVRKIPWKPQKMFCKLEENTVKNVLFMKQNYFFNFFSVFVKNNNNKRTLYCVQQGQGRASRFWEKSSEWNYAKNMSTIFTPNLSVAKTRVFFLPPPPPGPQRHKCHSGTRHKAIFPCRSIFFCIISTSILLLPAQSAAAAQGTRTFAMSGGGAKKQILAKTFGRRICREVMLTCCTEKF